MSKFVFKVNKNKGLIPIVPVLPSPTPTATPTPTLTPTTTPTPTRTPTQTPTNTLTKTLTPTPTRTPTVTRTPTITPSLTQIPTFANTLTNTGGTVGGITANTNTNIYPAPGYGRLTLRGYVPNPSGLYAQIQYNTPTGSSGQNLGVCLIYKDGSGAIIAQVQFALGYTNDIISFRFPDDANNTTTANCVYIIKLVIAGGVSLPSGAIRTTNTVGRTCP